MFDTLKDFYRGRLAPNEKDGSNRLFIQDLLQLRASNREKLCQSLTEEQKEFVRLRRDEMRSTYAGMVCQLLLCEEMLRRNMVPDFQTYRSVFCPDGGDAPWTLNRAG